MPDLRQAGASRTCALLQPRVPEPRPLEMAWRRLPHSRARRGSRKGGQRRRRRLGTPSLQRTACPAARAQVAQLVEHVTENHGVGGSIPPLGTTLARVGLSQDRLGSKEPAMDHFELRDGAIWCEEVPLTAIAEAAGTPVYVYSTAAMVSHANLMRAAVADCGSGEPLVAYALKANSNRAVLATLARAGLGADVVSIGEYDKARAAGVPAERIVFSGVGKTEAEMAAALKGGLLQFNVESVEEAR